VLKSVASSCGRMWFKTKLWFQFVPRFGSFRVSAVLRGVSQARASSLGLWDFILYT